MSIKINQENQVNNSLYLRNTLRPDKGVVLIIANVPLIVAFSRVNDCNLRYWTAVLSSGCLDCNVSNASVSSRVYFGYSAYSPLASHSVLVGYRNYVINCDIAVLNVPLLPWY